ncbi:MAG TPA: prolipoprotein diacylglyceryl transferase, partial [Cryomorphaceae bacterium]|nr:prolipoprotein diacylglyceryl transferase [Cryomorphaceae bacterium]
YFLIFLILYRIFLNASLAERKGFIFGMFLVLIFGFRFVIEYWKENQVSAEEGLAFNIGQYLSIPCVLAGLYFIFTAKPYRHE